jgi:hypothetical protein
METILELAALLAAAIAACIAGYRVASRFSRKRNVLLAAGYLILVP